MIAQEKKIKKYNIILSKLFKIVIDLREEQQLELLHYAEALFFKDKRADIRKACDIPINFAMHNRVYSKQIKNISRNGLFIETQGPFIVGDEILMSFHLEGFKKPLKIRGEVAHATRGGVGVEFKDMSPYVAEMVDFLIKRMKS
jgi:Tfp pilus assembly protein PilZ